ncbi:Integrase core domain-containing protein, partial [Anaerobranca californiensis DSM 14826]
FIIHKNRGRKPQHALSDELKKTIIELKKKKYKDVNFNHFIDLLMEIENIKVSYSSVHRILTREGISSPRKKRKRKTHYRRKRMPQKGMLVQIDASKHHWIDGLPPFTLHGAIDDATGEILALFFTQEECMEGYFEIVRQIITNYGVPLSLYSDRHTIFVSPNNGKLSIEEQLAGKTVNLTQFGRAMEELGINIIKAGSPQAKGRVEKLWDTLQDRLKAELKIYGINSIEAANAFLPRFNKLYNKKFAVEPEKPQSAFRPLDPSIILDYILCTKENRTIIEGSAFSYKGKYYQLVKDNKKVPTMPKAKLTVLSSSKIGIKAFYAGSIYDTLIIEERPKKQSLQQSKDKSEKKYNPIKPASDHPWKQLPQKRTRIFYGETDSEILKMLEQLFNSTRAWA